MRANPQSLTGQYLSGTRIDCRAKAHAVAAGAGIARAGRRDQAKSRFPQTEASKRRAERMAEHHARQGAVQALRVVGATATT